MLNRMRLSRAKELAESEHLSISRPRRGRTIIKTTTKKLIKNSNICEQNEKNLLSCD